MYDSVHMEASYKRFITIALFAGLAFVAIYGLLIFRFAPFTDETWDWAEDVNPIYIAAGRFFVALYHKLFHAEGVPWAYGIASAVYLSVAIAWQTTLLRIKSIPLGIFYAAVCLGIPQLSYLVICSFLIDAVCLAILLVTAAYWLIQRAETQGECRKKLVCYGVASVLMACAAGAYQFLIAFPCFFALVALFNEKSSESLMFYLRKLLPVVFVTLASFVVYYAVSNAFKQTVPESAIAFCQNYQQSLVTWGRMPFVVHVLHIAKQMVIHLLGNAFCGEWFYASCIIPVVYLSILAFFEQSAAFWVKLLKITIILVLYIAPFIAIVVLGEDGSRLHLFEPFACAFLWVLALQRWGGLIKIQYAQIGLCVLGFFLVLKAMYVVSDMANTQNRYFEENVRIAGEIKQLALQTKVPDGCIAAELPIYVSGAYNGDDARLDKYFSCVSGISTPSFYTVVRIPNLHHISESGFSKEKIEAEFATMPQYPHPDSCRYVEGKIIVKCSNDWVTSVGVK